MLWLVWCVRFGRINIVHDVKVSSVTVHMAAANGVFGGD